MIRSAVTFARRERWFPALVIFVLVFVLLSAIQATPHFADPDSFYHLGMAQEIRDHGPVTHFRWLPFTVLANDYADQHFLYHVALIPFATWLDPIAGMKLATSFFGALAAVAFFLLLARQRVPGAFWFTLALFLTNPFLFRMGLAKAPSVALGFLFIGLLLLFERRGRWLALWSALYVLSYGGFPVLIVATFIFALAAFFVPRLTTGHWWSLHRLAHALDRRRGLAKAAPNFRLVAAVILGVALGLLLHPNFPGILRFEQHQLIEIGLVNYRSIIGVGGEWYPYPARDLVVSGVFVSIATVLGLTLFIANIRKMRPSTWTGLFLFVLFLVATLKSKRYVEYYVPMGFLFSGLTLRDVLEGIEVRRTLRALFRRVTRTSLAWGATVALLTYVVVAIGFVAVRDTMGVARNLTGGQPVGLFAESGKFLAEHSKPNEVVFHDDWDVFPALFYHDRVNAYIAGLDATFLYRADPVRYHAWADVTTGTYDKDPYLAVHDLFHATWVHIGKDHDAMHRLIDGRAGFKLEYEDSEAWVYRVTDRTARAK